MRTRRSIEASHTSGRESALMKKIAVFLLLSGALIAPVDYAGSSPPEHREDEAAPLGDDTQTIPVTEIDPGYFERDAVRHQGPAPKPTVVDPASDLDQDLVIDHAIALFGDRFGGTWVSRDANTSLFVVGITNAASDDEEALHSALPEVVARHVAVRQVPVGASVLARWKAHAEVVMGALRTDSNIGADARTGRVSVEAKTFAAETATELRRRIPRANLELREDPAYETTMLHNSREAWFEIVTHNEGGLGVDTYENSVAKALCTTGFYLSSSSYGPFGTTAGHCSGFPSTNSHVFAPDDSFNDYIRTNVLSASNPTDADAANFSTATVYNYARVLAKSGTGSYYRNVSGAYSSSAPSLNTNDICSSGRYTTTEECGHIVEVDKTYTMGGRQVKHYWCFVETLKDGDSGAPVWRTTSSGTAHAAGMVSFQRIVDGVPRVCYSHIYYVTQRMNLMLPVVT